MHSTTQPAKPKKPAADKEGELREAKAVKKPRKTSAQKDDASIDGAKVKKPRKPRTKKDGEEPAEKGAIKEKAPRKPKAKKADGGAVDGYATQEKAVRKPKTKSTDRDSQTKLLKTRITKTTTSKDESRMRPESKKNVSDEVDPFAISLDFGLAEAVKRRVNWTPPHHTAATASLSTPVSVDLSDGGLTTGGWSLESEEKSKGFQDLLSSFGFSKLDGNTCEKYVPDGAGTKKRKLIELVKTNVATSTGEPVAKAKAPKKKPRTITAQATSAYIEEEEESAASAPLLQYFSFETTNRITSDGFKIPPRPRSKSPVKVGKGTAKAPILLSPDSALKNLANQDFVFGTSSQLARDESPTFLREVHAAMQASNEVDDDDPFGSSPAPFKGKSGALSRMKRNLWSAAARDGSGQLLDVEMVDLVNTPEATRHFHTAVQRDDSRDCHQEDDEPKHDIEENLELPNAESIIEDSPKPVGPAEPTIRLELLNSPSNSTKSAKSPAKSSTQSKVAPPSSAVLPASKATKPGKAKALEKPEFAAYTMAQLMKEVASYHFKPVKGRDQMIALLEKCWEGKQRMALGTLAINLPPIAFPTKGAKLANKAPTSSQSQAVSPKRPRGRPKKDQSVSPTPKRRTKTASMANALSRARKAQKKAEAVDEISDSDTPPSPHRRHASQIRTPPLPLQLSSSGSIDSRELSPASSQVRLFKYITTAVKNAPPSKDSTNPSWHEKILLYDPIVLEDLTVWLNTGALEKAGWDGEVDPKEVKKWCESKSICCLWKENLRGGTRSRY